MKSNSCTKSMWISFFLGLFFALCGAFIVLQFFFSFKNSGILFVKSKNYSILTCSGLFFLCGILLFGLSAFLSVFRPQALSEKVQEKVSGEKPETVPKK